MNILNNFLKAGLNQSMPIFGGEKVTWSGKILNVVYHEQFNDMELGAGGLVPNGNKTVLLVPVASFPDNSRPSEGEVVIVRGEDWRINSIVKGDVRWELTLEDKNKRAL